MPGAEFDRFATSYDEDLAKGLALTGEDKSYFARGRLEAVLRWLVKLDIEPDRVLDYGCGTGTAAPLLRRLLGAKAIVGVDPSPASLARAAAEHGAAGTTFEPLDRFTPDGSFDLAFVNGVFHHILPGERAAAIALVARALRPGGLVAFWENNPWNPGTRWVMRRVAFDRDAVMLPAAESTRLLRGAGLTVLGTEYHFVFPRLLRWLRGLEPLVRRCPLGGPYLVVARRPA